jgi:signal peptidase I
MTPEEETRLWKRTVLVLSVFGILCLVVLFIGLAHGKVGILCNSKSMFEDPCNQNYSLVRYNNTYTEPKVGDIVWFRMDTTTRYQYQVKPSFIYHRIINITEGGYITKGDRNNYTDPFTVKPFWISWRMVLH